MPTNIGTIVSVRSLASERTFVAANKHSRAIRVWSQTAMKLHVEVDITGYCSQVQHRKWLRGQSQKEQ
eukprot:5618106-Amphidinium_carterae.1